MTTQRRLVDEIALQQLAERLVDAERRLGDVERPPKLTARFGVANRPLAQSIPHNTVTLVATSTTDPATTDPLGWHAGGVWTPTVPGWYRMIWSVRWASPGAGVTYSRLFHEISKNAGSVGRTDQRVVTVANTAQAIEGISHTTHLDGASDTLQLSVLQTSSDSLAHPIQSASVTVELVAAD